MTKEQSQVLEAVGLLNARLRFFIGGAIKDALALGNRNDMLTTAEAETLLGVVEAKILTDARNADEVRFFLAGNAQPQPAERTESDAEDVSAKTYYEAFIEPALQIISEEYAERIGGLFLKFVCTGIAPDETTLSEDEKLLWNIFMATVEIKFNPYFSKFISDINEGE